MDGYFKRKIFEMSKGDFHNLLREVASTKEYAQFFNFGYNSLTEEEKSTLLQSLKENNIYIDEEMDLLEIAEAIAARASIYQQDVRLPYYRGPFSLINPESLLLICYGLSFSCSTRKCKSIIFFYNISIISKNNFFRPSLVFFIH